MGHAFCLLYGRKGIYVLEVIIYVNVYSEYQFLSAGISELIDRQTEKYKEIYIGFGEKWKRIYWES